MINDMEKEVAQIEKDLLRAAWHMRGGITLNEAYALSQKQRKLIAEIAKEHQEITEKTKLPYF